MFNEKKNNKNYKPNKNKVKSKTFKDIKKFLIFIISCLFLEIFIYSILLIIKKQEIIKLWSVLFIIFHSFILFWYIFILDKKQIKETEKDLLIPGVTMAIKESHTNYIAAKYVLISRLIININFVLINSIIMIIEFTK